MAQHNHEENLTQKTKEGTRPKPKPVSLDTWKKLLEETLNTSEVNENWKEYYIPFLENCGQVYEQKSIAVAEVDYMLCQKDEYKIPINIESEKLIKTYKNSQKPMMDLCLV